MKHLIKFVILGCMLTVLLSVLSLQKAEAKIPLSGAACSGCEELAGVAAVSSKDIWAVGGHYDSSSGQILSLIENWNGTSWSVVPSPNAGSVENLERSRESQPRDMRRPVWCNSDLVNRCLGRWNHRHLWQC